MDFQTRDQYRHVIERIAKKSSLTETEIAMIAIQLSREQGDLNGLEDRRAHAGYYLIGKGLPQLEKLAGVREAGLISRHPLFFYLGSILLLTFIFGRSLISNAVNGGADGWQLWLIGFFIITGVSHLSVAVVNWLATLTAKPKLLPRFDYSDGIPEEVRTLVVIPTIIASPENIDHLVEDLEVRFLANQDKNLHFGLLTDLKDAPYEIDEADEKLISLAGKRISDLNHKYPGEDMNTFFLFHRPRKWNPADRIWMGHERKRGKLGDLNALLLENAENNFSYIVGDTAVLGTIKYVITLDTDTQLPRDTARQLVGSMAHPLNKPLYDQKKQRVTEGYTILQPRVAVSLPGTNRSRYARLFGSDPGIDPYTRAVSDVYQDHFGEGSFIGKGIYEVESFERVLKDRFPENRILSHDLLEGCYARSGLLSDVLLFEEYPATYKTDVKRRIRWIRGDWQLLPWLFPFLPRVNGVSRRNPLSVLSWWKILDNIRRSLVPLALFLILVSAWTILPSPLYWTLLVIGIVFIPALISGIFNISLKPEEISLQQHMKMAGKMAFQQLGQTAFILISLPFEAFKFTHAILKTCWRLFISKKRLLEWNSATGTGQYEHGLADSYNFFWISPSVAAISAVYLIITAPLNFAIALPFIAAWVAFPGVAWWISETILPQAARLTAKQARFLKDLTRRTWYFFETFVGPDDNWLPPDNYQEDPGSLTAHRTSPTNIGLSLLANLAAYDFGYIFLKELLERTSNTFATMSSLEKYQGHFLNWYDTQTLRPLHPHYVSSVDSGNLAAHLITLKQGILAVPRQKITGPRLFEGINDTLHILLEKTEKSTPAPVVQFRKYLAEILLKPPGTLLFLQEHLEKLVGLASEIEKFVNRGYDGEYKTWVKKLSFHCRSAFDELNYMVPWILHPRFHELVETHPVLNAIPSINDIAEISREFSDTLSGEHDEEARKFFILASVHAMERMRVIQSLANQAEEFSRMHYDFLYDKSRHLQTIGYNVEDRRADPSYYDLLASEARISSFVAIAQDQLPQESWFAMGRLLTTFNGEPILLSWSGSMFEYLMPLLVMPLYENSLLHQTCRSAVIRQIEYGNQRGVPWGISESGYNRVDAQMNYQYRAFGVPGIGLKRGLADDLVIAPYATALALMLMPEDACENLQRLSEEGFMGKYGFYEAIDYTPSRVPRGKSRFIIKSFMAHHQGMSLLSLANTLLDRPMQKRFESDPLCMSALLLLHERIPRATAYYAHTASLVNVRIASGTAETPMRVFNTPHTPYPEIKLLSNGRYRVMVTNAGGGYSHWKDLAVTRWREDVTRDNWGSFCYIRDAESGEYWSTAYQPTLRKPEKYEAIFSEGRAEFRRRDHDIDTYTEIAVSPEDDIELRRVRLTNRTRSRRIIDITSYAEVVLASQDADMAHPAFSNLFVMTEIFPQRHAILCTRRPRSVQEIPPWMFHQMAVHGAEIRNITYETDRMKFIGRGNTLVSPDAMTVSKTLSGSQGPVLDPVVAIQFQIVLEPEGSATIDIVTGITLNRDSAVNLVEKYQDKFIANRVFELAWTHSQVVLQQINATESDAQLYGQLASSVIYAGSALRADPAAIIKNRRGQSGLWGYSISGDLPIVLLQIENSGNINLVRQLVQAHGYWRLKGFAVDLVIWNEDRGGYRQMLNDQIIGLISAGVEANVIDRPGGIFVRSSEQISIEDRILFQSVARAFISDSRGDLPNQLKRRNLRIEIPLLRFKPTRTYRRLPQPETIKPRKDLIFYNGTGGFTADGKEYVITITKTQKTPAPWINVLSNNGFGTVISENGSAYTWAENAREFRLTPWHNDPVKDPAGEAIYIRDEETGHFWTPAPLSDSDSELYICRHGFGYTVFEHDEGGIFTELWIYVAIDEPVKFSVLKIRNRTGRQCKLSVTNYVELVLGDMRHKSAMHIITSAEQGSGTIYSVNHYSPEFAGRTVFIQTDEPSFTFTCDRTEFIGRNGTMQNPEAMSRSRLSGKKGVALDPCAAFQVYLDIPSGHDRDTVFRLGTGRDREDAARIVRRYQGNTNAHKCLESVWHHWNHTLGAVQVQTPDNSLNVMANGWLLYQTLACRVWARTGFYQSGGAFGFRDQLQDAMALVHTRPEILRELLLLFAGRQFVEGDVQHWWHPPGGRGVRTHCSDDYLWLPLATSRYVTSTGDTGVLDQNIYFLEGRPVNPEDESYYDLPGRSEESRSLYEHCKRAILHGMRFGDNGLPLIGTCDWNDGMNLIGHKGKGESVWLGFFLYEVIEDFTGIARLRDDSEFVEICSSAARELKQNIEMNAWDGKWYRRAYFDDGTPLGSSGNQECQIDSISQSWSVLSGAAPASRSQLAMKSVDARLVRYENSLVQLLDPPFDKSDLDPGYIKGYVPGVRENGGQYTHAAIWVAMAFARLGNNMKAWEIFKLINPVNHALSPKEVAKYKVEPYVIAADVYAVPPHTGRGGWTWYTGSAGWMYRLIIESLLGLRLETDKLFIEPCIPSEWDSYTIHYRFRETIYRISVIRQNDHLSQTAIKIDGVVQQEGFIRLHNDQKEHLVEVFYFVPIIPPIKATGTFSFTILTAEIWMSG
jgi:cyclic beta-1,2-glucan synthetase